MQHSDNPPLIVNSLHFMKKYFHHENTKGRKHEKIHIAQQKEMLVIPFYLWYFIEWLVRLFKKGNAYQNISFEREAYVNEYNFNTEKRS